MLGKWSNTAPTRHPGGVGVGEVGQIGSTLSSSLSKKVVGIVGPISLTGRRMMIKKYKRFVNKTLLF